MTHRWARGLTALAGLVAGIAVAQDGAMSGKDIESTWVGKELIGTTGAGARLYLKLEADGKAAVTAGNLNDTGTWRAVDSGYCATWRVIRAGQERCFTVTRSGGLFTVLNPDGSLSGYINTIR